VLLLSGVRAALRVAKGEGKYRKKAACLCAARQLGGAGS